MSLLDLIALHPVAAQAHTKTKTQKHTNKKKYKSNTTATAAAVHTLNRYNGSTNCKPRKTNDRCPIYPNPFARRPK